LDGGRRLWALFRRASGPGEGRPRARSACRAGRKRGAAPRWPRPQGRERRVTGTRGRGRGRAPSARDSAPVAPASRSHSRAGASGAFPRRSLRTGPGFPAGPRSFFLRLSLRDRDADEVAPLGPRAVVVLHPVEAEEVFQHEPGVAGALADAAVRNGVLLRVEALLGEVDRFELLARLERAVLGGG